MQGLGDRLEVSNMKESKGMMIPTSASNCKKHFTGSGSGTTAESVNTMLGQALRINIKDGASQLHLHVFYM